MIGTGLYTLTEAAAFTGIQARNINRWLFGYKAGNREYSALWHPQLATQGLKVKAIGFHDLLEIRFVNAFRQHGVSLQAIRSAADHARELFRQRYPFTRKRFLTDGRSIFTEVFEETGDETLLDLVKRQYVFKQVVSPSLYSGIEYDHDDAKRWFPMRNSRRIVLDPDRAFGKPIVMD